MNSSSLSNPMTGDNGHSSPRLRLGIFAALLVALVGLASCNSPSAGQTGEPATVAPQRQPAEGTKTVAAPTPTVTLVAATPTAAPETPPATPCAYDYFFAPAPPLCPREAPVTSAAAEQPFTGGVMIWLESAGAIYVFFPDGEWQRFADTWTEEEAEGDPALNPPDGFFQPIRGFGKVWREHPELQERLGWATSVELGYRAQVQRPVPEAGQQVTFLRTYNGQVYYLDEQGADRGTWGIAASW